MVYKKNHQIANSNEHYTPKWVFEQLGVVFDLDVASPKGGSNVPCHRYYTQEDDGLTAPWEGLVWMNPPFSKPTPWVDRFIEHNNGIALLVVSTGKWFDKLWEAQPVIAKLPNLKFDRPDGASRNIGFRSMLFGLGEGANVIMDSYSYVK